MTFRKIRLSVLPSEIKNRKFSNFGVSNNLTDIVIEPESKLDIKKLSTPTHPHSINEPSTKYTYYFNQPSINLCSIISFCLIVLFILGYIVLLNIQKYSHSHQHIANIEALVYNHIATSKNVALSMKRSDLLDCTHDLIGGSELIIPAKILNQTVSHNSTGFLITNKNKMEVILNPFIGHQEASRFIGNNYCCCKCDDVLRCKPPEITCTVFIKSSLDATIMLNISFDAIYFMVGDCILIHLNK